MCMLHLFLQLKEMLKLDLRAIHVNHGVRGEQSDADEELVKNVCAQNFIPFISERLKGLSADSTENDMRIARYEVFGRVLTGHPDSKIATAHHLDDQMETFFMRLASGATLNGLRGIPVKRDAYIRPMLSFRRAEIDSYAAQHKLKFHEDATNKDISKLRNHVRHALTPVLKQIFGSGFYTGFARSLDNLNQTHDALAKNNDEIFLHLFSVNSEGGRLQTDAYLALLPVQRHAILQACVSYLNPLNLEISVDYWRAFDEFCLTAATGTKFLIGQHIVVIKNRDFLGFGFHRDNRRKQGELYPDQIVYWGRNKISIEEVQSSDVSFNVDPTIEYICADEISLPLTIRHWENGDAFYPLGQNRRKKISDFFIDQKIDLEEKKNIPVICSKDKIIWLAGLRLDNRFRLQDNCKKIFKLSLITKGKINESRV